ncbi:hypothetical protein CK203_084022 [Vitis vinifera]|uniref:Ubiquitin-like protease family profile domain-containing protein n=1 Tax=Vitis vinifera TaxID=29760 RepID=A0A438EUV3_VITVI|nr:hypothetical protein CK203_084022 [Vitis vinifera]
MSKTDITSSIFDPLRPSSMEAKVAYTEYINDEIEEEFEVNIEYTKVDQKWFQKIMLPREWLSDSHIDVALYFFRKRRILNSDVFTQKFTTTDTLFWQKVDNCWRMNQKTWNKYILPEDDILIDYAMGLYLRPSLKWSEVDVIHVPINLRNTHWCYKYYGENGDPKGERVWDIERLNSFPQQTKDGDCGMFLFKFAEYLMHNHPMDTLTGERMDWFREKMVVELFFHKELPM